MAVSMDLRLRVIGALKKEPSSLKVGKRFNVSASFVRKLRLKSARTGDVAPGTAPGRERLVRGEAEETLRQLVSEQPDATLEELCELLRDRSGVNTSVATMCRQLSRMGITLKKRASTPRRGTRRR
jgi:transposase